ncbi:MAG: EH signature domain-containing protein [Xanthomonadales bacterium]|jgi:hypothetical protein|nr:EH signature domain-containing protein [Xanthomonadales bacterium]
MSDSVNRLRDALASINQRVLQRNLTPDLRELDAQIAALQRGLASGSSGLPPRNHIEEAICRYYASGQLTSFRDAYLVSHGILIDDSGLPPLIDDPDRFPALLEGVDQHLSEPRRFRRCFQGLMGGYFGYDPDGEKSSPNGQKNWLRLQRYLDQRARRVLGDRNNPRWAECLQAHRNLFTSDPCGRYGEDLLAGRREAIDELRKEIGITDVSWFMRKLYLAHVRTVLGKPDAQYLEHLPRLVELLADFLRRAHENGLVELHRPMYVPIVDEGLALTLDRHAALMAPPNSAPLRELALQRWGSPWVPSYADNWIFVQAKSRDMVADWLKLEFIRDFFMLLADDRQGDSRRLNFWQRYISAIDQIHFALGSKAQNNDSRDYVVMRKRIDGLSIKLKDQVSANNAFIMRMGSLVMVEFSGYSNACYGYKATQMPFVLGRDPLTTRMDAPNSLKHSRAELWLWHKDGTRETWEQRFEAELAQRGIRPRSASGTVAPVAPTPPRIRVESPVDPVEVKSKKVAPDAQVASIFFDSSEESAFSPSMLERFAQEKSLVIEDLTVKGGCLWIRHHDFVPSVSRNLRRWGVRDQHSRDDYSSEVKQTLQGWGFQYKRGKGWWWKP